MMLTAMLLVTATAAATTMPADMPATMPAAMLMKRGPDVNPDETTAPPIPI